MRKIIYLLVLVFLFSCEEDVDGKLPFKEEIVISSILSANQKLTKIAFDFNNGESFVHLGKTIYPLDELDTNNAFIKNAKVIISSENQNYQLLYSKMGYWVNDEFIPKEGKQYKIEVIYNGKTATAETKVPIYSIDKIKLEHTFRKVNSPFDGREIYLLSYYQTLKVNATEFFLNISDIDYFFNNTIYSKNYSNLAITNKNVSGEFEYSILSYQLQDLSDTLSLNEMRYFSYELFDPAIQKFWETRYEGNETNGLFSSSGLNREGNIKNGLGFFYGNIYKIDSIYVDFSH